MKMGLLESIIDWTRTSLDDKIFDKVNNKYTLKSNVEQFIRNIIDEIDNNIIPVNDYYIKGSILSFQWLDHTDIDILIETNVKDDDEWRRIQDQVDDKYNDVAIPNTKHPLQIFVNKGKYDISRADGIYHLDKGWIKGPYNIRVDLDDYKPKFDKIISAIDISTGQLKRNLVDYNLLKDLPKESIENIDKYLGEKLEDLNESVENLVFQFKHLRNMRHVAFDNEMTPEEIARYGSHNNLPENVIYKLLERYHIIDAMRKLKEISEDGVSSSEVDEIETVIKDI